MTATRSPVKLALIAATTVAATIGLATTAHADDNGMFMSPSGNIRCNIGVANPGGPVVTCQIDQYTYEDPPTSQSSCPDGGSLGSDFQLFQGKPANLSCSVSALNSGYFGPWPTLDYGQARSIGSITCASEPSGMACTDSSTGHFFRVSRDSYQLG
jgi:hypothetical protein